MSERRRVLLTVLLGVVAVGLFLTVVLGPAWVLLTVVCTTVFLAACATAYTALGVLADALGPPKDTPS